MATHWGLCGLCKVTKNVAFSTLIDDDLCSACYRREFQPRTPCSRCGKVAVIRSRPDGVNGYCNACYLRELHVARCGICRKRRTIAIRDKGKPICQECYRREYSLREPCSICHVVTSVAARTEQGKAICQSCYHERFRAFENCTECSRFRRVATRTESGDVVCGPCYNRHHAPREVCGLCGEVDLVQQRLTNGRAICRRCYRSKFAPRPCTCSLCGKRRSVASFELGKPICGACHQGQSVHAR